MPKKTDELIDNKTKEKLTKEILDEINEDVKTEVCEKVAEDIRYSFNTKYKEEIKTEVTNEIIGDIKENIKKEQKKVNRRKSFKIFRLYIYIILLIACAVFMIYRLYKSDNLDLIAWKTTTVSNVEKENDGEVTTEKVTTTEVVKDLAYYKNIYGNLIDDIKITNTDLVKGNFEVANISMEDRIILAYNSLSDEDKNVEGSIVTIEEEKIIDKYVSIFGLDDYTATGFSIDGLNFAYSNSIGGYIAIGAKADSNYLVNNITSIEEVEDGVVITCSVALVKNGNYYSLNNTWRNLGSIETTDISTLTSLSSVNYKFVKVDNGYILNSIIKG